MLKKWLHFQLSLSEKGKPLHFLRPLFSALDTFLYEAPLNTQTGPHIRDAVDLKRWMVLVVFALLPCIFMAIWNTGVQSYVYSSGQFSLMQEFIQASQSFKGYADFVFQQDRFFTILGLGLRAFLPIVLISYLVGGMVEAIFAMVRKHEIAEGFLVTGILYPLILPPQIPYWMAAVGIAVGVIISKELFGGTGMNIVNPALTCRAFLFFAYPNKMAGDVWVGTNPTTITGSLQSMNQTGNLASYDSFAAASPLSRYNVSTDIKRIHVDAIATNTVGSQVDTYPVIEEQFHTWSHYTGKELSLGHLPPEDLQQFVTAPFQAGGLNLASEQYDAAYRFAGMRYETGLHTDGNFFFGNMLGSMGETSVVACILGAIILVLTGIGSWRTMVAMGIGAFITAWLFEFFSTHWGIDGGAWNPAKYAFPAYKHLILGGLAFGLVFMATDPVSSASMNSSKWIYGLFIGIVVIIIRIINTAYPEGVMLAILLGNVFAPLFDHYALKIYRKKRWSYAPS